MGRCVCVGSVLRLPVHGTCCVNVYESQLVLKMSEGAQLRVGVPGTSAADQADLTSECERPPPSGSVWVSGPKSFDSQVRKSVSSLLR